MCSLAGDLHNFSSQYGPEKSAASAGAMPCARKHFGISESFGARDASLVSMCLSLSTKGQKHVMCSWSATGAPHRRQAGLSIYLALKALKLLKCPSTRLVMNHGWHGCW